LVYYAPVANGFLILIGAAAILLVAGFFRVTTERERFRWGKLAGGWFAIALVVVTVLTYIAIALQ